MEFACSGSHPFARYADSVIYPAERYRLLLERNQWAARRIMTFALHMHLGMRDGDHAVAMINSLLPFLPHFLALSASSPFWQGEDTGLASSRITELEALPTAGHAPTYTSWREFETLHDSLVASGSIASVRDLWWDIRPRPDYGTVELRICDGLPTLSETVALVTLLDALARRLDGEYKGGSRPAPPPDWMIRENKWRASRYGLEAEILLDDQGRTAPLRKEVEKLMETHRTAASRSGSARAFSALERMLEHGCSYERQRRILRRSGSMKAVTEALKEELRTGRPAD
jgi:carboxylate-amine ligase